MAAPVRGGHVKNLWEEKEAKIVFWSSCMRKLFQASFLSLCRVCELELELKIAAMVLCHVNKNKNIFLFIYLYSTPVTNKFPTKKHVFPVFESTVV